MLIKKNLECSLQYSVESFVKQSSKYTFFQIKHLTNIVQFVIKKVKTCTFLITMPCTLGRQEIFFDAFLMSVMFIENVLIMQRTVINGVIQEDDSAWIVHFLLSLRYSLLNVYIA